MGEDFSVYVLNPSALRASPFTKGAKNCILNFKFHVMDRKVYEFISTQTNDPIVEWRTCKMSGEPFAVFQSDLDFYEKISPVIGGKKFSLPIPTLSPEERWRRRLLFKNERALFKNTCALTGKPIISIHSPDSGFKAYSVAARW